MKKDLETFFVTEVSSTACGSLPPLDSPRLISLVFHTPVIDMQDKFPEPIGGEMPRLVSIEPGTIQSRNSLRHRPTQPTEADFKHIFQSLMADRWLYHFKRMTLK